MKLYVGCLWVILSLMGCGGDSSSEQTASAEQVDSESPQDVAVHFFNSLLVNNNMNEAKKYATGSVGRVMAGYGSAKSYARTVLNMNFDKVEVSVDTSNQSVREFYNDRTVVVMNFMGEKDGGKVNSFREVVMLEENGHWKVGDIKADPFARSGI